MCDRFAQVHSDKNWHSLAALQHPPFSHPLATMLIPIQLCEALSRPITTAAVVIQLDALKGGAAHFSGTALPVALWSAKVARLCSETAEPHRPLVAIWHISRLCPFIVQLHYKRLPQTQDGLPNFRHTVAPAVAAATIRQTRCC